MAVKSEKDFYSGLVFIVTGGGFAWGATSYKIGDAARMGPGYFPLLLGLLLMLLGAVVAFKAMVIETEDGDRIGQWMWRPVGFIVTANVAFGVLLGGLPSLKIPAMGMVLAIYALTLIGARAGSEFRLKEVLALATILVVGSYVVFIMVLKLQIQVWPTFISG